MGLFGKKKKPEEQIVAYLGVDIGTSGIKVVELSFEQNRLNLRRWGYSESPAGQSTTPLIDDPVKAGKTLRDILSKSEMKAHKVIASLPTSQVFHAMLALPVPKDAEEDFRAVIEAQARKFLPLPLEEMVLDSNILDKDLLPKKQVQRDADKKKKDSLTEIATLEKKTETEKKYIRVLITGAPKVLVAKYIEVFRQAKVELMSLETEVFALIRGLIGKDPSRVMIVDIGAQRTNVVIVQNGVPYLTRGIRSGGTAVTQALAQSMGVSFEEAETMKRDLAYKAGATLAAPLQAAFKPILHEISYALQLYSEQEFHEHSTIEKVIITGGSSHIPGIVPYLTSALNANVYLGNPWARVATLPEERLVIEEVGPRLAVAVGLAMRGREVEL